MRTTSCSFMFLFLASACWGDLPAPQRKACAAAVVIDQSASSVAADRCGEVVARARSLLDSKARHIAFLAVGTGSRTTGGEPVVLVPWVVYDASAVAFEDDSSETKRRNIWLKQIDETCRRRHTPGASESPLFNAISRASSSLAAKCNEFEAAGVACMGRWLPLHSDMREGVHEAIVQALRGKTKNGKQAQLPKLDLQGATVAVCLGEHRAV